MQVVWAIPDASVHMRLVKEHSGAVVGVAVGFEVGIAVGFEVGIAVGTMVGIVVGLPVGTAEHSEGSTRTPLRHLVPGDTFILSDHRPLSHKA